MLWYFEMIFAELVVDSCIDGLYFGLMVIMSEI